MLRHRAAEKFREWYEVKMVREKLIPFYRISGETYFKQAINWAEYSGIKVVTKMAKRGKYEYIIIYYLDIPNEHKCKRIRHIEGINLSGIRKLTLIEINSIFNNEIHLLQP